MTLSRVLEVIDLLDGPVWGREVAEALRPAGVEVEMNSVTGDRGKTDFLTMTFPGREGASSGGDSPTTGIVGRLGGIGARPESVGLVSDGDGAVAALAAALALAASAERGDRLSGDVVISTHICPEAPTEPHEPCLLYTSPSPRDQRGSRMPSSA